MSFLNDRLFGSSIDPTLKVKLELRRFLNEGTKPLKSIHEKLQELLTQNPSCKLKSVEDFGFSFSEKGIADLSSRVPFARVWTAVDMVHSIEQKTQPQWPSNEEQTNNPDNIYYWQDGEVKVHKLESQGSMVYVMGTHQYNIFSSLSQIQPQTQGPAGPDGIPPAGPSDILGHEFKSDVNKNNEFMKPPAGVKSIDVETNGPQGIPDLTKKVTINFTVYNFEDYDKIYSKYFLNPGATIFVDYGWNTVKDLYSPFEYSKLSETELHEKLYGPDGQIQNNYGDLDVLIGLVTNFDSKTRTDGGFDCMIELVTRGSAMLSQDLNDDTGEVAHILNTLETELVKFTLDLSKNPTKGQSAQQLAKASFDNKSETHTPEGINTAASLIGSKYLSSSTNSVFPGEQLNSLLFGMFYSRGGNVNTAYVSIGLIEDMILNNLFGQGKSREEINTGKSNFNAKFDSKTSFINVNQNLIFRQKALAKNLTKLNFLFPFDYQSYTLEDIGTEINSWTTINKNIDNYQVIFDNINGSEKEHYSDSDNLIPMRECFIKLSFLIEKIKTGLQLNKALSKVLIEMLSEINKSFDDQMLFIITSDYVNNTFKFVEANSLGIEKEVTMSDTNREFTFKPYNKNTLIKSLDFAYNLPQNELSQMYAIQSLPTVAEFTPFTKVIDKHLTEKILKSGNIDELDDKGFRYLPTKDIYRAVKTFENNSDLYNIKGIATDSLNLFQKYSKVEGKLGGLGSIWSQSEKYKDKNQNTNENTQDSKKNKSKNLIYASDTEQFYLLQNRILGVTPQILNFSLNLSTYGCSMLAPGDVFNVDYLPSRFRDVINFQIFKVRHNITPGSWSTSLETIMRKKAKFKFNSKYYSTKQISLDNGYLEDVMHNYNNSGLAGKNLTILNSTAITQCTYADFAFDITLEEDEELKIYNAIGVNIKLDMKGNKNRPKLEYIDYDHKAKDFFDTLNKTYPSGERQYNWNEDIKNSAINKKGFKFNIKNQEGKFIQYSDFFAFDTKQSKENKEPINRTFVFEQEITMKKGQKYTLLVKDELWVIVPSIPSESSLTENQSNGWTLNLATIGQVKFYDTMIGLINKNNYIMDKTLLSNPLMGEVDLTDFERNYMCAYTLIGEDEKNKDVIKEKLTSMIPMIKNKLSNKGHYAGYLVGRDESTPITEQNNSWNLYEDDPTLNINYHKAGSNEYFAKTIACGAQSARILKPEMTDDEAINFAFRNLSIRRTKDGGLIRYSDALKMYGKDWLGEVYSTHGDPGKGLKAIYFQKYHFGIDEQIPVLPSKFVGGTTNRKSGYDILEGGECKPDYRHPQCSNPGEFSPGFWDTITSLNLSDFNPANWFRTDTPEE